MCIGFVGPRERVPIFADPAPATMPKAKKPAAKKATAKKPAAKATKKRVKV